MPDRIVSIKKPSHAPFGDVVLPASKSISNRLLIIQKLSDGIEIENLSAGDDTTVLGKILNDHSDKIDGGSGGTTLRFYLAYAALSNKEIIIDGSPQLRQRPVKDLINALNDLGANITYTEKAGHLPVKLSPSKMTGGEVEIDASVSSQFISALMLIAPYFEKGLIIRMKSQAVSETYIKMTEMLMREFGINVVIDNEQIKISAGKYKSQNYYCPPDWSAASYFYGITSLFRGTRLRLKDLNRDYLQGDAALKEFMKNFGVMTTASGDDLIIRNSIFQSRMPSELNLINNPDLAQTFAVISAVKGIPLKLSGLKTLAVKETDRLKALQTELVSAGAEIKITDDTLEVSGIADMDLINKTIFNSYNDHRMIMSLALLSATGAEVRIKNPGEVSKSFPDFFNQLDAIGFIVRFDSWKDN